MRIGLNMDGQFVPMTGIQYYVDSLLTALYNAPDVPHELCAFASLTPPDEIEKQAAKNEGTFLWRRSPHLHMDVATEPVTWIPARFQQKHPWLASELRTRELALRASQARLPASRAARYDIFHNFEPCQLQFLSYQPKKSVATVYDLATRRCAYAYPARAIDLWEAYWDHTRNRCAHIVAISESTKQDYMEAFGIAEDRITVTPLAARASAKHMDDSPQRRKILSQWGLTDTPYVLYAGTLEPRKNLHHLVKAFSEVVQQHKTLSHQLVLAGGSWGQMDADLQNHALECGIPGRVVTTGYVSNEQLNALMSGCEAFAYVSLYEGFGMPPLEAMTCGAPVITSNVSSLPEVVGDAGIQVNPRSIEETAAALYLLMTNATENARHRKRSVARAKEFTWERTARLTMEAYEKAAAY